jgi:hypothetical protein
MPGVPETNTEELSVSLPDVPLREGEERHAAALNLEASERRESVLKQMRELLGQAGEITAAEIMRTKYASGATAKQRQRAFRLKIEELRKLTFKREEGRIEGPCAPATVININPDPLTLQGVLARWNVPEAGKGEPVDLIFKGRKFHASYLTIRTPEMWAAHTGSKADKQTGVDMPDTEVKYIPCRGIAQQFYAHYVEGASDAQQMGGVLVFEGDIYTIQRKQLDRAKGKIWVPKMEITLDGAGEPVWIAEPVDFQEYLERSVMIQRNYAEKIIAEGHSYAQSNADAIRNQLSYYHRRWHNYALAMGYIKEPYAWATQHLNDSPNVEAVHCSYCHQRQTSPEQYFCSNCAAPFDPYKAFMAGLVVQPEHLAIYEEDSSEWKGIVAETTKRRARMAILQPETLTETTKKSK